MTAQFLRQWHRVALSAALLAVAPLVYAGGSSSLINGGTTDLPGTDQAQQLRQQMDGARQEEGLLENQFPGLASIGLSGQNNGTVQTTQAQQLEQYLKDGAAPSSLSASAETDETPAVLPPPSPGGGIVNPYAGGRAVASVGESIPGANSPFTSTGNANGARLHRNPYSLP